MLLKENDEEGKLIGQNMFMRTSIKADDGRNIPIMTMGPICIKNGYKRKGYGKILLDYSLEKAAELGCGALCFEGNIDFYGKSGFRQASEYGIRYHGLPEGEMHHSYIIRNREGITAENLCNILKRNDIKKSDAYQSGFLEGTTPMYEAYMQLKKSIDAAII